MPPETQKHDICEEEGGEGALFAASSCCRGSSQPGCTRRVPEDTPWSGAGGRKVPPEPHISPPSVAGGFGLSGAQEREGRGPGTAAPRRDGVRSVCLFASCCSA